MVYLLIERRVSWPARDCKEDFNKDGHHEIGFFPAKINFFVFCSCLSICIDPFFNEDYHIGVTVEVHSKLAKPPMKKSLKNKTKKSLKPEGFIKKERTLKNDYNLYHEQFDRKAGQHFPSGSSRPTTWKTQPSVYFH